MRYLSLLFLLSSFLFGSVTYMGGAPTWKPSVLNSGALPVSGNTAGDCRAIRSTGGVSCWNGSSWISQGGGGGTGNILAINTDETPNQFLVAGTAGTDFAIADDGSGTHTFNLPTASASNRGALSTTDWSTFNGKMSSALTSAHLFVGNGSNIATDVAVTGDIAISNAGVTSIASGVIVNGDVNASAAIDFSKLASLTSGNVLVGSAGNVPTSVAMSGAITIVANGTTTYNGTVPLNKGGTGQTTKAAAFDALSPMTTALDLIVGGASGTGTRLAGGSSLQQLRVNSGGTALEWFTAGGGAGDFSGPASSTSNAAVSFSGTGGKTGLNTDFIIEQISSNQVVTHATNNATANSTAAPDLILKAANKTAGTGNGGNAFLYGGTSAGGSDGAAYVGWGINAGTADSVLFRYETGHTQIRVPSQESGTIPAISFGTNNNNGIGKAFGNEMVIIAGGVASMNFDNGYVQPAGDLLSVGSSTFSFGAQTGSALFPFKYGYFADKLGIGIAQGGTFYTPNYHLDLRQRTASTAIYEQFTITTTTGLTSSDGTLIGLDSSGNTVINNQEALAIKFFTSGTEAWNINASGVLVNKLGSNESTGSGTALLGSNSPATTNTEPYTWLKVITSDGSTGYVPVFK